MVYDALATQVAVIGAGPAGLLLGALLGHEGVDHVVIEKHSAAHVLARVRAGILEPATVALLNEIGAAGRLAREGLPHDGLYLSVAGERHHIDLQALTGRHVTDQLLASPAAQALMAENYVGLIRER